MITKKQFNDNLIQNILSDCESRGIMKSQSFFENICEELLEEGELTNNYTSAEFHRETSKGIIEVFGYDYDEERKILTLINQEFFQQINDNVGLTKQEIENKLNRSRRFLEISFEKRYQQLEETSPAYSMAFKIYELLFEKSIDKICLMLVTNGENKAKKNIDLLKEINGIPLDFKIVDLTYLYNIFTSNNEDNDFYVDVDLPYLIAEDKEDYSSYLTMLNGEDVYQIYDKFGQKLLEQNVRTFLQFKGSVNKGIRTTIEKEPDKFFAYNNGITATASEIYIENNRIKRLANFQIVNGGQTTSAIYSSKKKNNIDISKVFVQVKLSVVKDLNVHNQFVSKVSEYANTQNKVNKSDFFSNSPFHKDVKEYSRRVWAPANNGFLQKTKWFYERVRGEYLNEQAYLKESEKKSFERENPKSQLLDKTFLAKSENSWNRRPDVVSKGAQYSFMYFADQISTKIEENNSAITEGFFKEMVSRVIMFKRLEKLISDAHWYKQSYRAQTVTYTIALFSHYLNTQKQLLNFEKIWMDQCISEELEIILLEIAEIVYDQINLPKDGSTNIGQWCKKASCWHEIKDTYLDFDIPESILTTRETLRVTTREDKKLKKLDEGINVQSMIAQLLGDDCWKEIYDHYTTYLEDYNVSPLQMDILKNMVEYKILVPSEKQSKILYTIYNRAVQDNIINSKF
ncbi:AIPR family protein [Cetobacterium sp.]|uniref:AIPR family protein n=1 Tax=Cetobacterium sp. TaxID=2071632 RepID=UPI003F2A3E37